MLGSCYLLQYSILIIFLILGTYVTKSQKAWLKSCILEIIKKGDTEL